MVRCGNYTDAGVNDGEPDCPQNLPAIPKEMRAAAKAHETPARGTKAVKAIDDAPDIPTAVPAAELEGVRL